MQTLGSWKSCGSVTAYHSVCFLLFLRFQFHSPAIPQLHQGDGFDSCGGRSLREGGSRTSSLGSGVLQSPLCHPQSHWGLATGDRPLTPQPFGSGFQFPHGDFRISSPISSSGGLDGVPGSPGSLPSGPGAPVIVQEAYLQVPVHPSSHHYLRFCVESSILQFRALCFGLSSAPQVFTRVMAPVSVIMHCYRFCILWYLDDWLVLGSSFREVVRARDLLLWLCQELGIWVNPSKSSLDPSQKLDYLGMSLQTRPLRVFPTQKRVLKLSSLLQEFVSCS